MLAVVVLACAAILVPFAVRASERSHAHAASRGGFPPTPPALAGSLPARVGGAGPHADLPTLLPATHPAAGLRVRVGDVTDGVLRGLAGGPWRVYVLWNGRPQPLHSRGPVSLGAGSTRRGAAYATWLAADGRLYTRVTTQRQGRYHVYAWQPRGGSAYTPPILRAVDLGVVCLDLARDTYGTCPSTR